jgi:hypothetical protein
METNITRRDVISIGAYRRDEICQNGRTPRAR